MHSVEIYLPSKNTSCSISWYGSRYHTQNGPLACGGGFAFDTMRTSCVKWSQGDWTESHSLREERYGHVSWATTSGVYLIGGYDSEPAEEVGKISTELAKEDGSVEEGFKLEYPTR